MNGKKNDQNDFICYIGNKKEISLEKIRLRIKNYLELDNVSILAGAGTSFHIGAPIIRVIPKEINDSLLSDKEIKDFYKIKIDEISKDKNNNKGISLEDFLNYLQADRFCAITRSEDITNYDILIKKIQSELFLRCNTQNTNLHNDYKEDSNLKENRYFYHEKLIKKILLRPINLRRVNLFTSNYDLAFEYSFDNTGIYYINGFSGFQRRFFHPESYDYDVYYPGQTTSGKVHRAEKVLRYYKLHGSLSWIFTEQNARNLYGIEEIYIDKKPENELVIYPCVTKKRFTLDLPYSELFRHFSNSIKLNQSVLFCIGYSFNDEHINDIIYQALSIPSFTLFVIDYKATDNKEINKLKSLNDPRILIIEGKYAKFTKFVTDVLPDIYDEKDEIKITETMNKLYNTDNNDEEISDV